MVTPCVGVWIETQWEKHLAYAYKSHPAWVCGLKRSTPPMSYIRTLVTPCVGVWIETAAMAGSKSPACHTLRGCVD